METILRTVLQEKAELLADKGGILYWVEPSAPLREAARLMDEAHAGCVLVMDQGELVGLLNEHDVVVGLSRHGPEVADMAVHALMTPRPFTVPPSMTVEQALVQCTDRRVRHLPVVDGGELLGLISIGDLVRFVVKDKERTIANLIDYIHGP